MGSPPRMNINDPLSIRYKFKINNTQYKKDIKSKKYIKKYIDFNYDNGPGPLYDEFEYEIFKDLTGQEWTLGPVKHLKRSHLYLYNVRKRVCEEERN